MYNYVDSYERKQIKRREQRENRQRLNKIEKRYVVTHKVYDVSNNDIQSISNSTVEIYGNNVKISDISYVQGNLLFLKIVKGMTTLSNKFLMKNSWCALFICDINTNTSKVISKSEILGSDILDYSYNASYTNNKTSVRITEVTNEDIARINKKVEESRKPKVAKLRVVSPEQLKKEEARKAKLLSTGQKIVELMFKIDEMSINKYPFIEIAGTRYLIYGDYTGSNNTHGYMEIYKGGDDEIRFCGSFLDYEYNLDYQNYYTLSVSEEEKKDLLNLANICKTSYCDDMGYMNGYVLTTGTKNYYMNMYLDEYDGEITIEDTTSEAQYSICKDLKLINNSNVLDTLAKLHMLCKNINKYRDAYESNVPPMLKAILEYIESDSGKQYSSRVSSLLNSSVFKDAIYYLILASKINKKYK